MLKGMTDNNAVNRSPETLLTRYRGNVSRGGGYRKRSAACRDLEVNL